MYVPGCGCCDESCEADEEVLGVEGFVDGSGHCCGRGSGSEKCYLMTFLCDWGAGLLIYQVDGDRCRYFWFRQRSFTMRYPHVKSTRVQDGMTV